MLVRIEPPSRCYREEDVVEVELDVENLKLREKLESGNVFDLEDLFNERIADATMSDYGKTEDEAAQAVYTEVAQELVELLNAIGAATGLEVSEESTFQGLVEKPVYEVVVDNIGTVYSGDSRAQAQALYNTYVGISKEGRGRAGDERVTFIRDHNVVKEFDPITWFVRRTLRAH